MKHLGTLDWTLLRQGHAEDKRNSFPDIQLLKVQSTVFFPPMSSTREDILMPRQDL